MLSYQHIYHAGNAADVHKHLWLLAVLEHLAGGEAPFFWLDTHAGRGLYDLTSAEANKLGEYRQGFVKFRDDLQGRENLSGTVRRYLAMAASVEDRHPGCYPGSAYIAAAMMRPQDRLLACEMHKGEVAYARAALRPFRFARVEKRDGYEALASAPPAGFTRGGALIDPSYEVKTEYARVLEAVSAALAAWPDGIFMIWYPLLPAGNHAPMIAGFRAMRRRGVKLVVDEKLFRDPSARERGLYGSGMVVLNPPGRIARRR